VAVCIYIVTLAKNLNYLHQYLFYLMLYCTTKGTPSISLELIQQVSSWSNEDSACFILALQLQFFTVPIPLSPCVTIFCL